MKSPQFREFHDYRSVASIVRICQNLKDKLNGLTLDEQIDYAKALSPELRYYACFLSVGCFIGIYFKEALRLPFGNHHPKFLHAIPLGERGAKVNIIAPRSSAKSFILAEVYPVHCILYKNLYIKLGGVGEHYILIVCRNLRLAKRRTRNIRKAIELKFPDYTGKDVWGTELMETANNILLLPLSRGADVRGENNAGWRPTLIVTDDFDDMDSLRNPITAEKDKIWWNSDLMQCGDRFTNHINVDTVKAIDAISMDLKDSARWVTHFIQAIEKPSNLLHPENETLWKDYQVILMDKSKDAVSRQRLAKTYWEKHSEAMTDGVVETWVDRWSYKELREAAFDEGMGNILREFQNYPEDRALSLFKMEEAVRFEIVDDGLLRSDGRRVRWGEISGATVYMDGAGTQERMDNCYAAVITVLWEPVPDGGYEDDMSKGHAYGYVFEAWLGRGSRSIQLTALVDAYIEVRALLSQKAPRADFNLCVEQVVDTHGDIRENYDRHFESISLAKGINETLQYITRTKNKLDRISALEAPIENGWLAFKRGLSDVYIDQMSSFPVGKFNDAPDATEGAWFVPVTQSENDAYEYKRRIEDLAKRSKDVSSRFYR